MTAHSTSSLVFVGVLVFLVFVGPYIAAMVAIFRGSDRDS